MAPRLGCSDQPCFPHWAWSCPRLGSAMWLRNNLGIAHTPGDARGWASRDWPLGCTCDWWWGCGGIWKVSRLAPERGQFLCGQGARGPGCPCSATNRQAPLASLALRILFCKTRGLNPMRSEVPWRVHTTEAGKHPSYKTQRHMTVLEMPPLEQHSLQSGLGLPGPLKHKYEQAGSR